MSIRDVQQAFQAGLGDHGMCLGATMVYAGKDTGHTVVCQVVCGEQQEDVTFTVPPGADPNMAARLAAIQLATNGGQ